MKSNLWFIILVLVLSSGCATNRSSSTIDPNRSFFTPRNWQIPISKEPKIEKKVKAAKKAPAEDKPAAPDNQMTGLASWYGPELKGKKTANGELYDPEGLTAAHMILPMNTWVQVINLENKRSVVVRINDRGPFKEGHIIDLTKKGVDALGFLGKGSVKVRLEIVKKASVKDKPVQAAPKISQEFIVQIAVFSTRKRADDFVVQFSRKYPQLTLIVEEKTKRYYVLAGPYKAKKDASNVGRKLKSDGVDNFVRRYKK